MAKQTRQEKKEEEAKIVAEMEAAMKEESEKVVRDDVTEEAAENSGVNEEKTTERSEEKRARNPFDVTPERLHCRRCKTLMSEEGVCPTCGFRMYVPMDKKKQDKIKLIGTIVLMIVFVALFVYIQATKG